ncbi:MAG TPA: glycoside hydrolase family 2 TIM barrel-domain containing protein, partial [Opitutaceae bacterium]|nr:glycoside hydrolase family 2 TIM barrel-domain containing protein [Opitutaceae bacterium]
AGDDPRAAEAAFDDVGWERVDLPHTWNALDGQDGGNDYRRGPGWYRRHLAVDAALEGKRLYLQFDGACLMADVYVNGVHLGNHKGGFARFRFDATAALRAGADNVIAVRVDNGRLGIPPTSADFTFFGGLYRDVSLLATDPVQISALDHGSPGVFLEQSRVTPDTATVLVRAELENHGPAPREVDVAVTVRGASGAAAAPVASFRAHLAPNGSEEVAKPVTIVNPHLWNARRDPYLYTIRVELRPVSPDGAPGALSDAVEQPLGLRYYAVDPDRGFMLNGDRLDLYGFNRHQDWPDRGWAISDAQEAEDFSIMMDSGATAVRVSHYQQSDTWYSRCDRSGIVAWAEIPFVNEALASPEFLENAKQQMRELVRQNFNHPAICFWGVGNETSGPAADGVIAELARTAREEDPSRLSTYASSHDNADPKNWHTDVVAFNRYFGWYHGKASEFAAWLDKTRADYPKARFAMSEFGAGASIYQHAQDPAPPEPRGPFHPEEYQCLYHEAYWAALKTRPYVWAKFIWCLHDFASDGRNEGDHPGRNDKGLVTYDRTVKKDAFFFYKANWSGDPVLHIAGSRFNQRTDPVAEVKIYSNAASVSLEVNGAAQGERGDPAGDRVFRWTGIRLSPGANRVSASARFGATTATDSCVWTLEPR